jgi:predicted SprT family Zn-dependent metalloprotease
MYPKIGVCPILKINNRLKTTGGLCYAEERRIELSAEMFYHNQDEYAMIIIPHEAIHQVDWDLNNKSGHGPSWKKIMVEYGLPPDRCHTLTNPAHVARKIAAARRK